ncbi:MAG: T9SS type A sorting domain-containing protein [Bacteroidales bacterium]|nr:T9SS type A sorting domain-containing protein [Bacteroidales bacterium]
MKKVSLLTMFVAVMLFCSNAFAQTMFFDFEGQTAGNKIAQTLGAPWTTWSNAPGGAEDGVFGEADGSMAAHFTYGNDQVLDLGGTSTGEYDLVFDAYVPNGKNGYFNVLHVFNGAGSTWAMQVYLCATNDGQTSTPGVGHGTVHAGSNGTVDIPCVWDEWMQYRVHINMDTDVATLYWNIAGQPEQEMCTWQWSLDSFGESTVGRQLGAMDFFPPENAATSEFYIDNIGVISSSDDQVLIDDDFEDYTVGNKIAVEAQAAGNDWWTTWSNNPGSAEDGVIATEDGSKCGHLTYNNDQVLLCGGIESGTYDLEFDILVPNGKNGYFNILHNFNGAASTWAMQAYLHLTNDGQTSTAAPGHGTIHAGSNGTADIPCVYDEWMHFRLHVDSDNDVAEFFYSTESNPTEQSLCTWQWSLDSFGESQVGRKLDAMDFFPPENAATSEYYLDNFKLTQIGEATAPVIEFDTDAINEWVAEDEAESVEINISNEQGTSIADWTAWIDFGNSTSTSGSGQLHYDAEPSENSSLVGFSIDEPTLYEIAAMIPGSAYAGAAMGTKITSVQYYLVESTSGLGVEAGTPVTFRVYGQGLNGQPGEVLAEKVVPYNQINTMDWTVATFDTPVDLTGYNVWISAEFTQAVDGYAIVFDGTAYQANSGYYRANGGGAFNSLGPDNMSSDYGCLHLRANFAGTPVPATWAMLSKPEGSMAIGATDEVTVNLNTIGLSAGDVMTADIIFKTNDPENDEVIIPLTLHVDTDAVIENAEGAYNVYPNPTTGVVAVEGENISAISIYNAAGQLVNVVRASEKTTIDMSVYGAGVYFLNIIDNANNTTVQRVVVK